MAKEIITIMGFKLDNEEYALPIENIKEIIKTQKATRVPRAQGYIEGVINLRGVVVPIINLAERFNIEVEKWKAQRIIIIETGKFVVGLMVDGVSEVIETDKKAIFKNSTIDSQIDDDFVEGICKLKGDRLLTLLNLKEVLGIQKNEVGRE
ncbi:MAG: chemotaxis protein CheW [Fusobacteriota bacterium]